MGPRQSKFPGESEVEAVARIYKRVGDSIQGTLLALAASGREPTAAERRRIRAQAVRLMQEAEKAAAGLILQGATVAAADGAAALGRRRINQEATAIIRNNLARNLDEIAASQAARAMPYLQAQTAIIGRTTDDALRRIGLRATLKSLEETRTTRETARDIAGRIAALPADAPEISDIAGGRLLRVGGRNYDPRAYAQLVARTTTREARTQGFLARAADEGIDLVTVSEHAGGDNDPVCVPYQGVTFSISGRTPGYPKLEDEPPFHPNCRHVLTPAENNSLGA